MQHPEKQRSIFSLLISKFIVLALALGIVASCASAATSTAQPTPSPAIPTENTFEQTPVAGSIPVYIYLSEFKIVSSITTFQAGKHYFLIIKNRGHDTHELIIMPDKPDGTPLSPEEQYKRTLIEVEPIDPGTTHTVNFTFPTSVIGRLEMACQMRGHYQAGMHLSIVLNA